MRHAPPAVITVDPPKEEGQWAVAQGPAVPPGEYQVRLEVGGEVLTAHFEIAKDPRNPATQADLEAQYRHALRVWERLSDLSEAVDAVRRLKRQLERWDGAGEEVGERAAALRDALTDVERELVLIEPRGSLRLSNPDMLDAKLRVLLQHAGFPARPTDASLAVAGELSRRLDGVLGRLDALLEGPIDEFNQLVRGAGLPALAPRQPPAPASAAPAAADQSDADHMGGS
jgi:hypothetical protein